MTAASCFLVVALGAGGAATAEAAALPQNPQALPEKSEPQCYATDREPGVIVCYRTSWKAEYRHGDVVYVPVLIQVPTPSQPPSVTIVDSLNDIHPTGTSPGEAPGST
ncbi:hypothetical protein [Streptomyces sp. RB17]|uniref:hypothetical protein n=1 Tax=Streptomyces sp. RB17 TaxID=2585197 RepID=UPI001295F47F|nr:hypothetical protein [Streptomyces sp. RB17]